MSALLEYECRVSVGGYDVITIKLSGKKYRMLQPRSERTRRFDLFEPGSSAFLEFAQTPLTEDGVKDFADRYGLLEDDVDRYGRLKDDPDEFDYKLGRDISIWFANIRDMRRYVERWRKSKVTGDFSKIIRDLRELFIDFPPVGLFLKIDRLSASPKLCIRAGSLIDALMAELVLAIDGNLNLGACVQCRKWFPLKAGRGRSDKAYCSNACRMRAYRKRKGTGSTR